MQFGEFFFDGVKKKIYEAPTEGFSFVLDGNGYRIYTPDDEPNAPQQLEYTTYALWSRYVDFNYANLWSKKAFSLSGGAYRYTDQYLEKKFSLIDLRLLNDWAYVPANYPHTTIIKGNLFPNTETNITFDTSRIDVQGVTPNIFFSDAGERAVADSEAVKESNKNSVFSSFGGGVWIDNVNGAEDLGTDIKPNGNQQRPVKTMNLALEKAFEMGFNRIFILGDYDLIDEDIRGKTLVGQGSINSTLNIAVEVLCDATRFTEFTLIGELDGDNIVDNCIVDNLTYFNGKMSNCEIGASLKLRGSNNIKIKNCTQATIIIPTNFDIGGAGQNVSISGWEGIAIISNLTGTDNVVGVGSKAGHIIIEDTCIHGEVKLSGAGSIDDNSGQDCQVINTMIDGTIVRNTKSMLEFLRPHHTGTGEVIYLDPVNGNDRFTGNTSKNAVLTIDKAQELVKNVNHDIIQVIPGNSSGLTIVENINMHITKDYLFIRGPGRDLIFKNCSIKTSARGTEFSGFRIQNDLVDGIGIHTTGAFTYLHNMYLENCTNGLFVDNASNVVVSNTSIIHSEGYGIKLEGNCSHGLIENSGISGNGLTGIELNTDATHGGFNIKYSNIIKNKIGVTLSDTTKYCVIDGNCIIENNENGDVEDLGTGNIDKSQGQDVNVNPADIWDYETRTLTEGGGGDCDLVEVNEKLDIIKRIGLSSVKIEGTELIMFDTEGEIQRWDLGDVNNVPSNTDVFFRTKV